MLYQVERSDKLDRQLAALNPEYPLLVNCWLSWGDSRHPRICLVDNPDTPHVLVFGAAEWLNFIGEERATELAFKDLITGRTQPAGIWPDTHARERWEKNNSGTPYIRLEGHGQLIHEIALRSGLIETENKVEEDGAFFYYFTGEPRLSAEVKHPCRVVEGLELLDLMRQGVDYDESGDYTRYCLEQGPSFVCEVDGEPVCWSCTHPGRAVGMIYTPPEHRRKGYARSLAALQIDHMLKVDGIAWCAILGTNIPSQKMVESLGAQRMEGQMYWRKFDLPPDAVVSQRIDGNG